MGNWIFSTKNVRLPSGEICASRLVHARHYVHLSKAAVVFASPLILVMLISGIHIDLRQTRR